MDDTAQNQNNLSSQTPKNDQVSDSFGTVHKEAGPISASREANYIEPSGSESSPDIPPELSEHGVEESKNYETPKLTEEHKKIGIEHAKESVPVITQPSGSVQITMSEEEAEHVVKTDKKTNDGILWIATIILKHAKTLHQKVFNAK